jgi:predicted anti-sigma-YlaC factor YlaD
MMTCKEFVDFLMSYLDDELEGAARKVFEMHLADCPACLEYMKTYQDSVEMGRCVCKEEAGPLPDDVPEGLVHAILEARKQL